MGDIIKRIAKLKVSRSWTPRLTKSLTGMAQIAPAGPTPFKYGEPLRGIEQPPVVVYLPKVVGQVGGQVH